MFVCLCESESESESQSESEEGFLGAVAGDDLFSEEVHVAGEGLSKKRGGCQISKSRSIWAFVSLRSVHLVRKSLLGSSTERTGPVLRSWDSSMVLAHFFENSKSVSAWMVA